MHIPVRVSSSAVVLTLVAVTAHLSGAPAPVKAGAVRTAGGFELTVDSIMRGPKLVGYPPTGLRWSGDSARLYFEWRQAGDDETSTWVVAREGGPPRKLTDEQRRSAPPVNGRWDRAHRRVLFVDRGDIVLLDTIAGTRRQVTRTTGNEANPRWARRESAITFTRDNNLFVVPLDSGEIAQLTDVQAKKRDPRDTDSQKFIKAEETKLIEHTRVEAEKKKKTEEKDKANALPKFELADRQSATDLQLSPDGTHVFILVVERSESAKRPNVPNYVTESSYTEDIAARTFVGDAQDLRSLSVMNLETGKSVAVESPATGAKDTKETTDMKPAVRWGMPLLSDDGALAIAHVRAANNKDRWLVAVDPENGKVRVLDTLHDDAWVREVGGFGAVDPSFGLLADQKHVWFLSERDGWMHLYSLDATAPQPSARQLTQGKWEIDSVALSTDRKTFYIDSSEIHPGERHLYAMPIDGGERTRLTSMTGGTTGEASPDGSTFGLIYSSSTAPNEVYLMPNRAGAAATRVTTTRTDPAWKPPMDHAPNTRSARTAFMTLVGCGRDPVRR